MSEVYAVRDEETGNLVNGLTGELLSEEKKGVSYGEGRIKLDSSEMNEKALALLNNK
nr:hypothetical protein [Candidatus Gracilibacteria bacterium]